VKTALHLASDHATVFLIADLLSESHEVSPDLLHAAPRLPGREVRRHTVSVTIRDHEVGMSDSAPRICFTASMRKRLSACRSGGASPQRLHIVRHVLPRDFFPSIPYTPWPTSAKEGYRPCRALPLGTVAEGQIREPEVGATVRLAALAATSTAAWTRSARREWFRVCGAEAGLGARRSRRAHPHRSRSIAVEIAPDGGPASATHDALGDA
jgi:hypothetical protein